MRAERSRERGLKKDEHWPASADALLNRAAYESELIVEELDRRGVDAQDREYEQHGEHQAASQ